MLYLLIFTHRCNIYENYFLNANFVYLFKGKLNTRNLIRAMSQFLLGRYVLCKIIVLNNCINDSE